MKYYTVLACLLFISKSAYADFCFDAGRSIGLSEFLCTLAYTDETTEFVCDYSESMSRWTTTINSDASDVVAADPTESFYFSDNCPGEEITFGENSCTSDAEAAISSCKSTYFTYTTSAGVLCGRITFGLGASFCGAVASTLIYNAMEWCENQGENLLLQCN